MTSTQTSRKSIANDTSASVLGRDLTAAVVVVVVSGVVVAAALLRSANVGSDP